MTSETLLFFVHLATGALFSLIFALCGKIKKTCIRLAGKAAQILKLDYCGVDLLKGKDGEPILCEVNSNAFLKGIEEVTGINIAYLYAKHIDDTL